MDVKKEAPPSSNPAAPSAAPSDVSKAATPTGVPLAGAALTLPGDLELPLRFEIGERMLTLRELEALAPGVALPLESDPLRPVSVTCHGRKLASGQLVDLGDGRLGVLLTEVGDTGRNLAADSIEAAKEASLADHD